MKGRLMLYRKGRLNSIPKGRLMFYWLKKDSPNRNRQNKPNEKVSD